MCGPNQMPPWRVFAGWKRIDRGPLGWRNRPRGARKATGRESIDSGGRVRRRLPETMHHAFVGRPASAEVSATPSRTRLRGTDGRSFQRKLRRSVSFPLAGACHVPLASY
ncbi:hypothetical protein MUK42_33891 [Musa troglodytarum]|uniref:Uncharacterized protein n=1 Tax=Musa troglodytarum TaxID=320322 RepID=A0A9E7L1J3_9LILI|nr:hypothetical protein MUK42_33891 [Musa troglodytarum]